MARKPADPDDLYSKNIIRIRILQTVLDDADEIKKLKSEFQHMEKQHYYAFLLARGLLAVKNDLRLEGLLRDQDQGDDDQEGSPVPAGK